ncbi:MAG: phage integrase N-terminal SAM-like domain-containing protein [Methylobacter sp.]
MEGKVSASTQNQALSALLFLYKEVLLVAVSSALIILMKNY